ncbi:DNA mismatch repair protein MutH, partial [Candidatus Bathyarchaeota archaeon]|nr:DNA mismatch repair protein MutH [Candidatus Bathyarchaeota archaeon]
AHQSRRVSIWIKSMVYTYLRKNNVLIPTSTELRRGLETHRVPGALTVQPKAGVYFNTVVCDFESLYPSCIDSYNLSYETVNCPHEECRKNRINECEQHWVCTKTRGFYSVLVGALKDLRIHWFKPLSKSTAASEQERKNAQDLARLLKLISVSSYGVTVRIHGLACPPLAECITGYGRWALQTTWNMAETKGLHPTYGDTDSIFLDNPEPAQVKWLIETAKEKLKLDLTIDKQYSLCVLSAAKKAYFGILLDGTPDIKGLTAVKSNSPKFVQEVFQDCVKELSQVKTPEEYELAKKRIAAVFQQAVSELKCRRIQLEDLVYSVRLYFDPNERLTANVKVTPQPYQCAIQLL